MKKILKLVSLILAAITVCCAFVGCKVEKQSGGGGGGGGGDTPVVPKGAIVQPYDKQGEESKMPTDSKQYKTFEGKKYEIQNGKVQLVQDQSFQTGLNVLGLDPGVDYRDVKGRLDYNGQALSNATIDPWEYTQWYVTPGIHQQATHVVRGDVDEYYNDAKTIRINHSKQSIYLSINSKNWGGTSYWPHALIEKSFTYTPHFGEMKSLKASLKFCVEDYINWQGAENAGKAAQVSFWFFVTDRKDKTIDNGRDCFFGIPIFESRPDIGGISFNEVGQNYGWESQTKDALFKVARYNTTYVTIKDSKGNVALNTNTSKVAVGEEYYMEVDMLGAFDLGLQQLKNYVHSNKTIQDEVRALFAGGKLEDFFITGFNIGWEMPNGQFKS